MDIGIIGIGGVGGYFGGKLTSLLKMEEYKNNVHVYFIARNKHLDEIKKNGLILSTKVEGVFICTPTLATDNFHDLPELDLCILCIKGYDLSQILLSLREKIKKNTVMIPLLNGVDIYDRVRAIIPNGMVCPACVYIGTHMEKYGKVTQNGGNCTIYFGKDPQKEDEIPNCVFDVFDACSIKYKLCDEPNIEIWSKYIFIAAFGMMTASEDVPFGRILESEVFSGKVIGIMKEIEILARKLNIHLPENIVEDSFKKGFHFPYETQTSFQRDFSQKEKPNEAELFGTTILRMGKQLGVETPVTFEVNNKLIR